MNSGTGEIVAPVHLKELTRAERNKYDVKVKPANLPQRNRRELAATGHTRISKNTPCPCGSGKRFQRCHRKTGSKS
jgi:uncharacterized protein YecA (UPF0149 family)